MAPRTCVSPDELGISLPTNANAPRAREVRPRAERFAGRPRIVKPKRASWWSSTFPRRAGLCIVSGYESVHVKDALAHPSGLVLDMAVRAGSDSVRRRRGNKCSHLLIGCAQSDSLLKSGNRIPIKKTWARKPAQLTCRAEEGPSTSGRLSP